MRIIHVVPSYFPAVRYGGPIFAVHALCRALVARGHTVEVFTTSIDGSKNSSVDHQAPHFLDGVKVRYFATNFLRRLSWAPSLSRALSHDISGADIVHLHSVFLWPTWAAARVAAEHSIPYVLSPRGMLVEDLIQRRHHFLKSAWIRLIEKSNLERASAIHVTSTIEGLQLAKFDFRLPQISIIPNGADPPETVLHGRPADDLRALEEDDPLILYFGRMSWKKGLDKLLQGFARSQLGILAIVGTDDENLAPHLVQLARSLGVSERVQIVPRTVTGAEKEYVFSLASVFVLTSDSENFGNTVVEAMLRRIPVIVTPEVGACEIVRESGGGLIVGDSPDLIGEAIDRLAQNLGFARSMGERGSLYVSDHLSWTSVAERMEALYSGLIN